MEIIFNGIKKFIRRSHDIKVEKKHNPITNIKTEMRYKKLSNYIHTLIDILLKSYPHLQESYVDYCSPTMIDDTSRWKLVDWINAFPRNESRIIFLLNNDIFLKIVGEITREYMRCDGVCREFIFSEDGVGKRSYSLSKSIEILQEFKSIV